MNDIEKRRGFIINIVYVFLIGVLIYIAFKYLLPIITPLIVAWIFASILNKPINLLTKKIKINHTIIAIIVIIVFYLVLGSLLVLLGIRIFSAIESIFLLIPNVYNNDIEPYLFSVFENIQNSLAVMDPTIISSVSDFSASIIQSFGSAVSSISVWVVGLISNYATTLPGTFIKILFTIISSIFMVIDYDKIVKFVAKQFNNKTKTIFIDIKNYIKNILLGYIKSYSFIMLVTFCELTIGFLIVGIDNAIFVAMIIAIFDILPILGTGTIMVPWIVVSLIQQNFPFAIQLAVIYVIVTIVRNIIEPKIVGIQMGLAPLVTLTSLFIGAQLFGMIGLVGFPILLSLLNYLNKKGTIKIFK